MTLDVLDKHNRPVTPGDAIRVVHFGEQHRFTVERVTTEHGLHYLHGRVEIKVPAGSAEVEAKAGVEPELKRDPRGTPARPPAARRTVAVREELPAEARTDHVPIDEPQSHPKNGTSG